MCAASAVPQILLPSLRFGFHASELGALSHIGYRAIDFATATQMLSPCLKRLNISRK